MRSKSSRFEVENPELLIGDSITIAAFCLYKQITAIALHPGFEGWLAPLHFNPLRFLELLSFGLTLGGSWVAACALTEGYRYSSTSDLPTTLVHVSRAWLTAMPVAAAQLVLLTAAESGSLVGDTGFGSALPLAASGPGEPFVTASQMLGVMTAWRSYYALNLDMWNYKRDKDAMSFKESVIMVGFMALTSTVVITTLQLVVDAEMFQSLVDTMWPTPTDSS